MLAKPAHVSSGERVWESRASARFVLFILTGLGAALFGQEKADPPPPTKTAPGLAEVLEGLRKDYPDGFLAGLKAREIARRLLAAAEAGPGTTEEAIARLLAADALDMVGESAEARKLREAVRRNGPLPAFMGRAAFEIGLGYFLEERYTLAERSWRLVADLDPASPWIAVVARYRPYFEVLRTKTAPDAAGEFSLRGQPVRRWSAKEKTDGYVVLHFWSAAGPGEKSQPADLPPLAVRIEKAKKKKVEVLGVNLDEAREPFEAAVRDWKARWPQHRDGKGFVGPLPAAFGIPRTPHYAVFDPTGAVIYLGGSVAGIELAVFPRPKLPAKKKQTKEP